MYIKGNTTALLQVKTTTRNAIGEAVEAWNTVHTINNGILSLQSGDSRNNVYNAKIQESTHVFLCNYFVMDSSVKAENTRMLINGKTYDVKLIDDPDELHYQYEVYLSYTGG